MKPSFFIIFMFLSIFMSSASSCNKENDMVKEINNQTMEFPKIKITVNSQIFTATLLDNQAAKAFREMLPMTINMIELNGNEKYFDLPSSLPTNAVKGNNINVGDLSLYGNKALVLFYKSFHTSYSYTKLGYVDNPEALAEALGMGNVVVTFEKN